MTTPDTIMPTGIAGLDHLLEGGIVRGNSLLIEGPPGSGKTTFAIRSLYQGIVEYGEPGLILTFEEFPRQIYQEAASLGMDLAELEKEGMLRVVWTPPERILEGFTGQSDLVENIIEEMGVKRLVIDSITHFKRVAHSEADLRENLAEILNFLKLKEINAILVKELERMDDATIAFEEYLVDASLRVSNSPTGRGGANGRFIEVRKTRGQSHISGLHPFELGEDGVTVYPRLRPEDVQRNRRVPVGPRERVATAIGGLDRMLEGGFWDSSFNLVSGYQGTGKTVLAYHFINEGLVQGENCRVAIFNRQVEDVMAAAASIGFDWREALESGQLGFDSFSRGGMNMEKFLNVMDEKLRERPARRFMLESLDDLFALPGQNRSVADGIEVLAALLRDVGTTGLLLHRSSAMAGDLADATREIGEITDCVIQFSIAESDGQLRRFISVRKHSSSGHDKELREIIVGNHGMRVAENSGRHVGILSGQALLTPSEASPEVMPRIENIRMILREILSDGSLESDVLEQLKEARRELVLADVVLREHFGLTQFHQLAARKGEREEEPALP